MGISLIAEQENITIRLTNNRRSLRISSGLIEYTCDLDINYRSCGTIHAFMSAVELPTMLAVITLPFKYKWRANSKILLDASSLPQI
jgi:hypothetical protein